MLPTTRELREENQRRHRRFYILAVFGAFLIALLVGLISPAMHWTFLFVPTVVMVGVMFGYRSYCETTLELTDHDTGDNVYYLGFLFTLASLAAGLIVLGLNLRPDRGTEAVVSFLPAFGMALVTTLFGMVLRVLLTQRDPAGDMEAHTLDMRKRLQEAAVELKNQADATTEQFAVIFRIIQQKIAELPGGIEGLAEATRSAEASLKGAADAAAAATGKAVREVETAVAGVGNAVAAAVSNAADNLASASENISIEAGRIGSSLSQSADAAQKGAATLDAWSRTVTDALSQATATLGERESRSAATAERLVGAAERIARELEAARLGSPTAGRRASLIYRILGAWSG